MSETASAPGPLGRVQRLLGRELRTIARTRTYLLLTVALAAVLLGIALTGSASAGYVPTVVDLLTPLELLVPIVAVAFGYRAIVADESRGELDVLATYPVTAREHVLGVYAGRAVGLMVAIATPMVAVGAAVALRREEPVEIYATTAGADSPILFARFVVLTLAFALVVLAIALAISALAGGTRNVLVLAIIGLIVLLVGLDLVLVFGLSVGYLPESVLLEAIAISPLSAYRGLVFETVIATAAGTGPETASVPASLLGLAIWLVGSLAVATWALRR